jgi:putative salt-induced outer membrane protein YdiY
MENPHGNEPQCPQAESVECRIRMRAKSTIHRLKKIRPIPPRSKTWFPRLKAILMGLCLCGSGVASADSLFLLGGERLQGRIISEDAAKIIIESHNLGRQEILRERIMHIERTLTTPTVIPTIAPRTSSHFFPGVDTNRFDWIQLKSGEWLKGELKSLQDDKVEFDSDELDLREFEWEDVWQVYAPRQNEALFDDRRKVAGPIHITQNNVLIQTPQGQQVFDRAELVAVTPGGPREINYWSGKLSLGMTLRSGNTVQTDYNIDTELIRRTPNTRFSLDYLASLSQVENQEVANNSRLTTQFDYWLSRHLFMKIPFAEYYRDPIQNIKHRITVGCGIGYEIIDRPRFKWDIVMGPAYQQTLFDSVAPGEEDTSGNAAVLFQMIFDTKITRRIDFESQFQIILAPEENGGYTHHWQSTLEIELTKRLDLDVSFIWDRVSKPTSSFGGTAAKPDDFRTVLSLGVNF